MKKFTLHKLVLIILVNTFPDLLARYYREYQEIMETIFKDKVKKEK
jgi:hypothetical protein